MTPKKYQRRYTNIIYGKTPFAFFNSFKEETDYVAKQRAKTPYENRLTNLEQLRKRVFHNHLLPDGTWRPIARTFKIIPPYTDDDSQ